MVNVKYQRCILLLLVILFCSSCNTVLENGEQKKLQKEIYIENRPYLSLEVKKAILNRNICKGMTKEDFLMAGIKLPGEVYKIEGPNGRYEYWVYYKWFTIVGYVCFDNGILSYWTYI